MYLKTYIVDDISDVLLDGINQAKDASSLLDLVDDGTSGSEGLALVQLGDVVVDDGLDLVDGIEQGVNGILDKQTQLITSEFIH